MASAEVGLAPSGCESYSPTYLAQALPDTLRLLRKRGAWEMSDHNEIAGQGERVRKILNLVKCLLTGERPRPSGPARAALGGLSHRLAAACAELDQLPT